MDCQRCGRLPRDECDHAIVVAQEGYELISQTTENDTNKTMATAGYIMVIKVQIVSAVTGRDMKKVIN